MASHLTRRQFLRQAALTGSAAAVAKTFTAPASGAVRSPNDKLNIAIIGPGGRGAANLQGVITENIVAICDVDGRRAAGAFEKFPRAKKYRDFRRMLGELDKQIDAVVVSTPDHTHAVASVTAMKMDKHCYCEKPLTWSVQEARVVRQTASQHNVATQMGNQGTASAGLRSGVKVLQAGIIGKVREIHVWSDRPWNGWAQGEDRPQDTPPVPAGLDWDLWLGPAPRRPYHPAYLPGRCRMWQQFGTGALGDMGCHHFNHVFKALKLCYPTSISASATKVFAETAPLGSIVTYDFPAREGMPPLRLYWYDGGLKPPRPQELESERELPGSGNMYIGDKGIILGNRIVPESKLQLAVSPPRMASTHSPQVPDRRLRVLGGYL